MSECGIWWLTAALLGYKTKIQHSLQVQSEILNGAAWMGIGAGCIGIEWMVVLGLVCGVEGLLDVSSCAQLGQACIVCGKWE